MPRCHSSALSGSASRRAPPLPETCAPPLPLPGSGRATTGRLARPNPSGAARRHHTHAGYTVASPSHRSIVGFTADARIGRGRKRAVPPQPPRAVNKGERWNRASKYVGPQATAFYYTDHQASGHHVRIQLMLHRCYLQCLVLLFEYLINV